MTKLKAAETQRQYDSMPLALSSHYLSLALGLKTGRKSLIQQHFNQDMKMMLPQCGNLTKCF